VITCLKLISKLNKKKRRIKKIDSNIRKERKERKQKRKKERFVGKFPQRMQPRFNHPTGAINPMMAIEEEKNTQYYRSTEKTFNDQS
jgi:hypothetical protein